MSQEQLDRIEAKVDSLAAKVAELGVKQDNWVDNSPKGMIYPGPNGLALIGGWVFAIDLPIAADWKPSMLSVETAARYGRIGAEPSNAFDSGLPKRSPSGYPIVYPMGQFGPFEPGQIKWGELTFPDEASLRAHQIRLQNQTPAGGSFSPRP